MGDCCFSAVMATFWLSLTAGLVEKVKSFCVRLTAGLVDNFTSIRGSLISKLRRDPPLLPQTNTDSQSIMQNPQRLKIGTLVSLIISAILGLLLFQLEDLVSSAIVVVLVFVTLLYNGLVFGAIVPGLGNFLQSLGITLIMCLPCVLAGTLLPAGFSLVCWVCAAFNLMPFLYLQRFEA